ncbi:MAPEG family protein [Hyphomicrobium sp. NDB2Meth4]|uniref:MAPEG family protein n=1 Tax=Hyphomicrobium sp. NDB2Meth4 TaxID=1892846 RepID=UPI00092FE4E2|nr:MAPEG family protein [Hyphomicrobium sp. NDB2Meth4]
MPVSSLMLPVFIQVALTFAVLLWAARLRMQALRSGAAKPSDVALRQPNWPPHVLQVANSYQNELELPMLFYAVVAFILITSTNSIIFVVLAWVFVISRLVRAFIHTGSNVVRLRGAAFGVGVITLAAMWVILAVRILATGA